MPWGITLFTAMAVLLVFGIGRNLAGRTHFTVRGGLLTLLALIAGCLLPIISVLGEVELGVGSFLLPAVLGIYVLARARGIELFRGILAAIAAGGAIYMLSLYLPEQPQGYLDYPLLVYGAAAGAAAFLAGFNVVSTMAGVLLGPVLFEAGRALQMRFQYSIVAPIQLGRTPDILGTALLVGLFLSWLFCEMHRDETPRLVRREYPR